MISSVSFMTWFSSCNARAVFCPIAGLYSPIPMKTDSIWLGRKLKTCHGYLVCQNRSHKNSGLGRYKIKVDVLIKVQRGINAGSRHEYVYVLDLHYEKDISYQMKCKLHIVIQILGLVKWCWIFSLEFTFPYQLRLFKTLCMNSDMWFSAREVF